MIDREGARYDAVLRLLKRARRSLVLNTLAGGSIRWLCVAGGGLAVALALAAVLPSSVAGTLTLSLAWLSLAITSLAAFVIIPLVRLPGLEALAVRLDSTLAPGENPLISSLQLGRKLSGGGEDRWVSRPIMEKAVEAGARAAREMDSGPVVRDRGMGTWGRNLTIVAAFWGAMGILWPGEISTSAWMLTNPMAAGPSPIFLSAGPGDVELDAGSDLTVEAVVVGTDQPPQIRARKLGGVWRRAGMHPRRSGSFPIPGKFVGAAGDMLAKAPAEAGTDSPEGAGGEETASAGAEESGLAEELASYREGAGRRELPRHYYSFTLKGLQEDQEYKVVVADRASSTWRAVVNQPPRAVAFRMNYTFPDYTGLPPQRNVSASGDIAALKGASVELEISANRDLAGARMDFGGSAGAGGDNPDEAAGSRSIEMTPTADRAFLAAFRLMEEDKYKVGFVEKGGRERSDPRTFKITPLPDHPPMVRIVSPGRSVDLSSEMTVDVSAYAADDYGISEMRLVHFRDGAEESRLILSSYSGAPRELYESHEWDLTELGLLPGEVVYYCVEVFDNDTVSGPKAGRSEVHSARFPTMAEIYERVDEGYEEGIEDLADQLRRGRELKEKLEEISRELKSSGELSWEQRQSVKGALSDREKLTEAAKEIAESLNEVVKKMGGSDLVDEEVVDKIMEIQRLLSEITDPELKESMEKLNEAVSEVDKEELAKAMEKLEMDHEKLLKNLDKTIELLKRLKAEEQMRAVRERIEDLKRQQDNINSSLEKDDPAGDDLERLSRDEEQVKEGLEGLESSLSDLQQALAEIDAQASAEMEKQAQEASEEGLQGEAQKAADRMKSGSPQGAIQPGKNVSKGLSSMSEQMQSCMDSMRQRQTQEMAEKLGKAARDLVFLSKGQEAMVSSSDAESPQALARSQFQLHSGAAQVADDLEEVIRSSFSLSRRLGMELGDALHKMESATSAFETGRKQAGLATSWEAVPSLNKAALQLMKASQSMTSMSLSSCQSPSGQDAARQEMMKLCGMQREVNAGTQGLVKKLSEEGGRLQRSTQEQLANLAARQEMIRKGMKEVSGELGDRKDVLGRLDELAEEMKKVIGDMENENVDRKTVRRQQQILSRLLDAQRSIRRRDTDNERISRVGMDDPDRLPPGAIPPELLDAADKMRSDVLQGKADPIPSAYRRLVDEYFRVISAKGF